MQENSMQVVAEENENDIEWVANNQYVELEDSYPDEFQGDN